MYLARKTHVEARAHNIETIPDSIPTIYLGILTSCPWKYLGLLKTSIKIAIPLWGYKKTYHS